MPPKSPPPQVAHQAANLSKSLDKKLAEAPPSSTPKKKKIFDPRRDPKTYSVDELNQMLDDGEISNSFTVANLERFITGQITWAELTGLTMQEAYSFAEIAYNLFEQGKYDQAQTIVEGLVIANPYDGYFHGLLGAIYGRKGMFDESRDSYTLSIQLDATNISSYVNRAEIYLQRGDVEKALKDLKKAVELDPKGEKPFGIRARALAVATAEMLEEALRQKGSKLSLHDEVAKRNAKKK
jgi:tetratricopeptide (TPR) repeat protein